MRLRTEYFDSICQTFIQSIGLPLVNGGLTEKPEPVTVTIQNSELRPDNQGTRNELASQLIAGLHEQIRRHSIRELREVGVLIEAQRINISWCVTASVRY